MFEWFCHYDNWDSYQAQYVRYTRPDGVSFFWMVPNTQTNDWEA